MKSGIILIFLCIVMSIGTEVFAEAWYDDYCKAQEQGEQAKRSESKDDWIMVVESLEKAIENDPTPEKDKRMYGTWRMDYYPYLNLGRAYLKIKKIKEATYSCKKAEKFGIAPEHEVKNCLDSTRTLINEEEIIKEEKSRGLWEDLSFKGVLDFFIRLVRSETSVFVVIGIDKYMYKEDLFYAVNDAKEVKKALLEYTNFTSYRELYDENATKNEILKVIDELSFDNNLSRIIFFFAGHGHNHKLGLGTDDKMGFFLATDSDPKKPLSTAISMNEVEAWAKILRAHHVLFIFDSCFSGHVGDSIRGESNPDEKYIPKRFIKFPGRHVITAGTKNDPALEKSELEHGTLTHYLLKAFQGKTDISRDGIIMLTELIAYLDMRVLKLTKGRQHPQLKRLSDDEGQLFIQVKKD